MDTKSRVIIGAILALSGKYDLPGQTITIKGYDAHGKPVEETHPALDHERLERDVEAAYRRMHGPDEGDDGEAQNRPG